MSRVLGVTLAVLLGHYLLDGAFADLGAPVMATAPAILLLSVAWGLLASMRLPPPAAAVLLAVLVPARGPLCDAVLLVLPPGWGGAHFAVLASLAPLGFVLGRHLAPLLRGGGTLTLAAGGVLGELLIGFGAVGLLPGALTGAAVALGLAGLTAIGRTERTDDEQAGPAEPPAWEATSIGLVVGLLFVVIRRVVPSYATPSVDAGADAALALALPALLVAVPTQALVSGHRARALGFAVGSLALALAVWLSAQALAVYNSGPVIVGLTHRLRNVANAWLVLDEYRAWLLHFVAYPAAGLGLLLGTVGRRPAGPLLLGLGLGLLSDAWVLDEPVLGPWHLLLVAAGVAVAGALTAWHRGAVALLPLALLAPLLDTSDQPVGFDGVRRVGDYASEGWHRSLAADVVLFSTGTLDNLSVDGRRQSRTSFTGRRPWLDPRQPLVSPDARPVVAGDEPAVGPHLHEDHDARGSEGIPRRYGVRVAGVPMHADHTPTGVEGSMGRLMRLFAVPGRALVVGVGAELVGLDLAQAGICPDPIATTPMPLGKITLAILAEALGLDGLSGSVGRDPRRDLFGVPAASLQTVLVTPEPGAWPLSGWALHRTELERLAALLAPGGRCLAWLDSRGLSERALAGRVAAFGSVFGESSLALVEPRGLDGPLVLLVGWRDEAGRPTARDLGAALPWPDETGFRTRLRDLRDLGALLLLDGAGVARVATDRPALDRDRPLPVSVLAETGWAAVAPLRDPSARLPQAIPGAPDAGPLSAAVLEVLVMHGRLFFELERLRGVMTVEVIPDVDWDAFEREVDALSRAAAADADDPLLMLTVASLLEPLLLEGELTRFASVFDRVDGQVLPSWRVAALHAGALHQSLLPDRAEDARRRALELFDAAVAEPRR